MPIRAATGSDLEATFLHNNGSTRGGVYMDDFSLNVQHEASRQEQQAAGRKRQAKACCLSLTA
jgi:hypothetical protein